MFIKNFYKAFAHTGSRAYVRHFCAPTCLTALLLPLVLLWDLSLALELNSERIERLFGSYSIRLLEQENRLRVSGLFSNGPDGPVCRTLATVRFQDAVPAALSKSHAAILEGASVGATLKSNGWNVEKTNRYLGDTTAGPDAGRIAQLMLVELPLPLALHVYDLGVRRGDEHHHYATIAEVHHPDYLDAASLKNIYAELPLEPLTAAELADINRLTASKMRVPAAR